MSQCTWLHTESCIDAPPTTFCSKTLWYCSNCKYVPVCYHMWRLTSSLGWKGSTAIAISGSPSLMWDKHINQVCSKARQPIGIGAFSNTWLQQFLFAPTWNTVHMFGIPLPSSWSSKLSQFRSLPSECVWSNGMCHIVTCLNIPVSLVLNRIAPYLNWA